MNGEDTKALVDRVKKLEAQNKWMRIAILVICAGLVGLFFSGAGKVPEEIKAKKFTLVDEKGKTRAMLQVLPSYFPSFSKLGVSTLNLYDERGEIGGVRAKLQVSPLGPVLFLFDEEYTQRAMLDVSPDGPGLRLLDEKGEFRASLRVVPEGRWPRTFSTGPELLLRDEKGEVRAGLSVSPEGPALGLYDENGRAVFSAP